MYVPNSKQVDLNKIKTVKDLIVVLKAVDTVMFVDVNKYPEVLKFTYDSPS